MPLPVSEPGRFQRRTNLKKSPIFLHLIAAAALAASLIFAGCEGKQGPQGPAGPAGPGPSELQTYLGDNGESCAHCHGNTTSHWAGTGHAEAYTILGADTTSNYCLQCHTTGFDDVYDHSGNLVTTGLSNGGYDDADAAHKLKLRGVQCESCHGPMGPALNHEPEVAGSMNGETCGRCHPAWTEYEESGHGTAIQRAGGQAAFLAEFGGTSCQGCHVSEGFIKAKDADYAGVSLVMTNQVTCATCHDPHDATNEYQLRTLANATSPFSMVNADSGAFQISGLGKGQLCVQCHHARRDKANIGNQVRNGSNHPGPHESPQGDMFVGQGCLEVAGATYERGPLHPNLTNACLDCHIVTREFTDPAGPAYGHTFEPQLSKCQTCHPGATNFNIGGVQTEVEELLDSLVTFLPRDNDGSIVDTTNSSAWTPAQRTAAYAYFFVEADGSMGVHNRDYTISLLENAIHLVNPSAKQ